MVDPEHAACRPPDHHQTADDIRPLHVPETQVRHATQTAAVGVVAAVRRHRMLHAREANFRCGLVAGLFAATSFAGVFPAIGVSIPFGRTWFSSTS